jgi:hypothetical protein
MESMTSAARTRRHLSRQERQCHARAEALSRRTPTTPIVPSPVMLATQELELIDRLVRRDRTPVSTALLAIAGIGAADGVLRPCSHGSTRRRRGRRPRGRSPRGEPSRSLATSDGPSDAEVSPSPREGGIVGRCRLAHIALGDEPVRRTRHDRGV